MLLDLIAFNLLAVFWFAKLDFEITSHSRYFLLIAVANGIDVQFSNLFSICFLSDSIPPFPIWIQHQTRALERPGQLYPPGLRRLLSPVAALQSGKTVNF